MLGDYYNFETPHYVNSSVIFHLPDGRGVYDMQNVAKKKWAHATFPEFSVYLVTNIRHSRYNEFQILITTGSALKIHDGHM
jgi:hypothetical protein